MLSNGSQLGNRYVIKKPLGDGLAGRTYLAMDLLVPDSVCAIKELAPEHEKGSLAYQHIRRKFQEEARCLRVLKGYNEQIPKLLDEFPANDTLYIVQEYIEGETLQSLIDREIMNQSQVRDLLVSLLKVLAYVHSKDILHRDIKPTNIILRAGTQLPVLIDFGSGKDLEVTQVGTSVDISQLAFMSKGYTAPEQVSGEAVTASDVYSLGKTAIHALLGKHPKKVSDATWRDQVKGLLPAFGDVIDKSISPYLGQRYKHPADMLDDLEKLEFPEDEKLVRQISHSLTIVEREPRPFPAPRRKCDGCEFVLTPEYEFCPNCAAYNPLKLDHKNFLLHSGSAERYFDEIVHPTLKSGVQELFNLGARYSRNLHYPPSPADPDFYDRLDQELEIKLWRLVNEYDNESLRHRIYLNRSKIENIAIVPLAILWGLFVLYVGNYFGLAPTVYWLIPGFALPLLTLLVFDLLAESHRPRSIRKLYRRQRELEYQRQQRIKTIKLEKASLQTELAERSKTARHRNQALKDRERIIHERIADITRWIDELKSLLSEISDERLLDNDLQRQHAARLRAAVKSARQLQNHYQSKQLEIGFLRINNFLQSEGNVEQMSLESRTNIKKQLKEMIHLCDRIGYLQKGDVASSTEGSEYLERILEIARIASKLWNSLLKQEIELNLPRKSRPAPEFVESLALLNAYVSIDDFTSELTKLEMRFEGARGGSVGERRFIF